MTYSSGKISCLLLCFLLPTFAQPSTLKRNPTCSNMYGAGSRPEFIPEKANYAPAVAHSVFGTAQIVIPKDAVSPTGYICVSKALSGRRCGKGLKFDSKRSSDPCISKILPLSDLCGRVNYTLWEKKEAEVCLHERDMNEVRAAELGERALFRLYGARIFSQRPFTVSREGKAWRVTGTLHCRKDSLCKGGVGEAILGAKGEVLSLSHDK